MRHRNLGHTNGKCWEYVPVFLMRDMLRGFQTTNNKPQTRQRVLQNSLANASEDGVCVRMRTSYCTTTSKNYIENCASVCVCERESMCVTERRAAANRKVLMTKPKGKFLTMNSPGRCTTRQGRMPCVSNTDGDMIDVLCLHARTPENSQKEIECSICGQVA